MVDNFPALRGAARELESSLLPWRCLCCGGAGADGLDLCAACHADLPWNVSACARCALPLTLAGSTCGECQTDPPPFVGLVAPLRYAFPVDRLIVRLKFAGGLEHGRLLGALLAAGLTGSRATIPRGLPLLPMPLHPARLAERGFNQAAELARVVAPALGAVLTPDLARRLRPTPPQARLDAAARRANLRGAFTAAGAPQRVIVIDDVVTTGATVRELSKTLRAAGCEEVFLIAVARAGR